MASIQDFELVPVTPFCKSAVSIGIILAAVPASETLVIAIDNDAPLAVLPVTSVLLVVLALKYANVAPIIATTNVATPTTA